MSQDNAEIPPSPGFTPPQQSCVPPSLKSLGQTCIAQWLPMLVAEQRIQADESPGLDALNSLIPTSFVPTSAPAIDRGNISVHLPCPSSIHGTALFLFLVADFHMSFTISAETIFQVLVCKSKTLGMLFQAQAKSKPRCFSFSFGSRHFCNKKLVFTSCTKVIIWLKGIQ